VAALSATRADEVALYVDGTGVGTAVVEILRQQDAIRDMGARFKVVTITAGREVTRVAGGWHVAKGELVSVAQVALQRGRLNVAPALPEARTLRDELATFEVTLTEAVHATCAPPRWCARRPGARRRAGPLGGAAAPERQLPVELPALAVATVGHAVSYAVARAIPY